MTLWILRLVLHPIHTIDIIIWALISLRHLTMGSASVNWTLIAAGSRAGAEGGLVSAVYLLYLLFCISTVYLLLYFYCIYLLLYIYCISTTVYILLNIYCISTVYLLSLETQWRPHRSRYPHSPVPSGSAAAPRSTLVTVNSHAASRGWLVLSEAGARHLLVTTSVNNNTQHATVITL